MRRTLLRYLVVEEAIPFFVSLFVLTLVLFLGKTIRYTKLLFITGSGLADFGKLLLYLIPYLFAFTIPMATLMAILLAFARLTHDNELTAMKAAGLSFYQTIPPVALLGHPCAIQFCSSPCQQRFQTHHSGDGAIQRPANSQREDL
jgi:lipopolysaccharide export system permease protein